MAMALASSRVPWKFLSPSSTDPYSQTPEFLISNPKLHSLRSLRAPRFIKLCYGCSKQAIQSDSQTDQPTKKKKRKPRPSFIDQIQDKWSLKTTSLRDKLPWEQQGRIPETAEGIDEQNLQFSGLVESVPACQNYSSEIEKKSEIELPSSGLGYKVNLPPWVHGNQVQDKPCDFEAIESESLSDRSENLNVFSKHFGVGSNRQASKFSTGQVKFDEKSGNLAKIDATFLEIQSTKASKSHTNLSDNGETIDFDSRKTTCSRGNSISCDDEDVLEVETTAIEESQIHEPLSVEVRGALVVDQGLLTSVSDVGEVKGPSNDGYNAKRLPWVAKESAAGGILRKSNTEVAEKLIPDPELNRLRNMALRMVERIKVGAAGVTQELVDSIHEKWKMDEIVKLKFEGPPSKNMRRIHEILETRTGGLVIWRSGSSVVLYRGMTYQFDCVQSYVKQNIASAATTYSKNGLSADSGQRVGAYNFMETSKSSLHRSSNLSEEELDNLSELNILLDELGPRFKDWSGREPLPVDADLLPAVIPGYKPPFRLLPHGTRPSLRDKEMTQLRRTARTMPPHFALGRNRELQGLALAMLKLWKTSAIAKIAIKRGVHNTCNERMAEELKVLTGGTLVSRNKEYIVFYRGNDFLPQNVTEALVEAEKMNATQQDEEERARQRARTLIESKVISSNRPLVAGTLSETMAATSRWANEPSIEEIEKMKRDSAVARHAALVKYLQRKLALATAKMMKAEKVLLKLQGNLEPADLPTDLETLSAEERFLYRKIGLSMKPFLLLGARGIFDGTIENIHLHWKYRELAKLIVERKSLAQVKHLAISLEAESGGVLVSVDKTTKGHAIILYRGKNYQPPSEFRPKNLLTRRQALARSIELQRREALKHHVAELQEKIEKLKSELEDVRSADEIDEKTLYARLDTSDSDDEDSEEEWSKVLYHDNDDDFT